MAEERKKQRKRHRLKRIVGPRTLVSRALPMLEYTCSRPCPKPTEEIVSANTPPCFALLELEVTVKHSVPKVEKIRQQQLAPGYEENGFTLVPLCQLLLFL